MPTPDPPASAAADSLADALLREDTDPAALALAYANAAPFAGGRYRLGDPLGAGAMGRVFRTLDTATGTEVALKVMHDEHRTDPALAARFREETSLLEKCAHPHVVRLLDSGTDPATGTPWMVMELMAGTLKTWLQRPLHLPRILTWMRAACQAVAHAHSLGIIHRDLKPSNLLLTADHVLKVADFGIAVENGDAGSIAPGTDLHALGTLFYTLLTGRSARANCLLPSEAAARPRWCDDIYDRATSERPGRQFATALEMDAALARAEHLPIRPPRRWLRPLLAAAAAVITGLLLWKILAPAAAPSGQIVNHQSPIINSPGGLPHLAALPAAATPAEAMKDKPFTLPGGHYFLPVPDNPGVLLAATEVTRAQFQAYADTLDTDTSRKQLPTIVDFDGTGLSRATRVWTDNCPNPDDAACGISALTADAYCKWLTDTERAAGRIPPAATVRLPWASEWLTAQGSAAALRGPSTLVLYAWGDTWPPPLHTGNFAGPETLDDPMRPKTWLTLARRDPFLRTAPVASFPPNPLGFYDIEGNVSEWAWEPPTTRGHLPPQPPASTARLMLGLSWTSGRDPWKPFNLGFDYVGTGLASRGLRLALEYEPPRHPRFLITLRSITDTSGQPDTDKPGTPSKTFAIGDKVRVTWRVENWGAPGTGILRSNAATPTRADDPAKLTTLYRGPGLNGDSKAGGILRPLTFNTGEGAWFSFDMDTTGWPPGLICVSSYIHDTPAPDALLLESSTNGAGIARLGLDWWLPAFDLR